MMAEQMSIYKLLRMHVAAAPESNPAAAQHMPLQLTICLCPACLKGNAAHLGLT